MKNLILFLICFSLAVQADTPPPNTVKAKLFSGDGLNSVDVTSGSIKVNITNSNPIAVSASVTATIDTTGLATSDGQASQTTLLTAISSKLTAPIVVSGTLNTVSSGIQTVSGSISVLNFPATQAVTGTFYQATQPISGAVSISNFPALQDVSGSWLTNTQLRASPLSVDVPGGVSISNVVSVDTGLTPLTNSELRASAVNTYLTSGVNVSNTVTVTGALTDAQLRATPIPVSGSLSVTFPSVQGVSQASNWTTAISGTPTVLISGTVPVSSVGTVNVNTGLSQGLTDTQLRASPVEVSGALTVTFPTVQGVSQVNTWRSEVSGTPTVLISGTVPVSSVGTVNVNTGLSQGLTDAQLRATSVNVSNTTFATSAKQDTGNTYLQSIESNTSSFYALTDTQLRATAVPVSTTNTVPVLFLSTPSVSVGTVAVTGPLTDTQLRASLVPVSATSQLTASSAIIGSIANASFTATQGTATNLKTQAENYQGGSAVAAANPLWTQVSGSVIVSPTGVVSVSMTNQNTGFSTSALQTTGNSSLSSIDTKTPSLGQATMANSVPVAIASNQSVLQVSGTVTANPSSTYTVQFASTPSVSAGQVTVIQPTGSNLHTVIDSGTITSITNTVGVSAGQVTVLQATATNLKTQAENYQGGTLVGTANPLWTQVSGTVGVSATGTTPISAATLPLPSLASTSTKQSDGSQKTQIVDGSGNVIAATSNALNINISSGSIANTSFTATQGTATNLKTQSEVYQGGVAVGTAAPLWVQTSSTSVVSATGTNAVYFPSVPSVSAGQVTVLQATATNLKTQAENYQGGTAVGTANPLWVQVSGTGMAVTVQNSLGIASGTITSITNSVTTSGTTQLTAGSSIFGSIANSAFGVTGSVALASETTKVIGTVNLAANATVAMASETTKVIGTVNFAANAVVAMASETTKVIGTVRDTGFTISGTATALPVTGIDASNTTTTALGSGAANKTFTGAWTNVANYSNVTVLVSSDKSSATDGFQIQQSNDGSNVQTTDSFTIPLNSGQLYSAQLAANFFRVVYTNGAVSQTGFVLQSKLHTAQPKDSSVRLADNQTDQSDVPIVKSALALINGTSTANVSMGQQVKAISIPVALASDTGTLVTSGTQTLTASAAIIGSIANTSFTATQATGTNLHTVVDSGTISTITNTVPVSSAGTLATGEVPQSGSANALTNSESQNVPKVAVKASAGRLYFFSGYSAKASAQWIQVFNSAGIPAANTVPIITIPVGPTAYFSYNSHSPFGRYFSTGIYIGNSSSGTVFVNGTSDTWIDAQYQ